jgi:hypothetical protein
MSPHVAAIVGNGKWRQNSLQGGIVKGCPTSKSAAAAWIRCSCACFEIRTVDGRFINRLAAVMKDARCAFLTIYHDAAGVVEFGIIIL